MIKFTIGSALFAFAVIIGGYMLWENHGLITTRERSLADISKKFDDNRQMIARLSTIKDITMIKGQDQKSALERNLDIGQPYLTFRFNGQPMKAGGSDNFYRHSFSINGPAHFTKLSDVVKRLIEMRGVTVHSICVGCTRKSKGLPDNVNMVQIEGYIYVYNPGAFK